MPPADQHQPRPLDERAVELHVVVGEAPYLGLAVSGQRDHGAPLSVEQRRPIGEQRHPLNECEIEPLGDRYLGPAPAAESVERRRSDREDLFAIAGDRGEAQRVAAGKLPDAAKMGASFRCFTRGVHRLGARLQGGDRGSDDTETDAEAVRSAGSTESQNSRIDA